MGYVAIVGDHGFGDDLVIEVERQFALLVDDVAEQHLHVFAVHLAGMVGNGGGEVLRAEDCDVVLDDGFPHLGKGAVTAPLGGEIDNDAAGLHGLDHLFGDENRRLGSRNRGGGNDHILFRQDLGHQFPLAFEEVLALSFRIAALVFRGFGFQLRKFNGLGADGNDLLPGRRADIVSLDDASKPLGLIAGRGVYPKLVADAARAAGIKIRLLAFEDETTDELWNSFPDSERGRCNVGQLGKWLKILTGFGCQYSIAAGQIKPGKLFRGLNPDLKATAMLMKLKRRNAETIFSAIAQEIQNLGIVALDARSFLDDQLATAGFMTKRFEKIEDSYVEHGVEIATEMARLDVGQGVVVRKGTVIAVEAFEGTDPMLKRAGAFQTDQLIFVKTVKRQQDYRFDVPVFGLRTLDIMQQSGIGTAVLKAGSVIMVEKERILAQAAKAKIQIIGF